jgi:hypothetical protein
VFAGGEAEVGLLTLDGRIDAAAAAGALGNHLSVDVAGLRDLVQQVVATALFT